MNPKTIIRSSRFIGLIASAATLHACGGGSGSSSTSAETPVATITAVSPKSVGIGAPSTFTITGTNLPPDLSIAPVGCTGLSITAGSSATTREFTCTPTTAAVTFNISYGVSAPPFSSTVALPSISSVATNKAAFGLLTTFTISGANLPNDLVVTPTGCSGLSVMPGSSSSTRQFTCTPDSGTSAFSIAYGGIAPYRTSLTLPASITSITANHAQTGSATTYTIDGVNLPTSLLVSSTDCNALTQLSSTSTTSLQFICTPVAASTSFTVSYGASTPYVTSLPASLGAPSITSVTSAQLMWGKQATINVAGYNLPSSLSPSIEGCASITPVSSASTTLRQFTCTPSALTLPFSLNYGAASPYITTLNVPRPQVTMSTGMGTILVELYPENSPVSVKNFLNYVNASFYTNTLFHRVVKNFVAQGGGFVANASGGLTAKTLLYPAIALESNNGLSNTKYTLAMARTSVPDSATAQFYFNTVDNSSTLDYKVMTPLSPNGYAVFGKAIAGTAVLDSMNQVSTGANSGMSDVPLVAIPVISATQTQ